MSNLGSLRNLCPVQYTNQGTVQLQTIGDCHLVYFSRQIYLVCVNPKGNQKELADFLRSPVSYIQAFQDDLVQVNKVRAQESLLTQLVCPDSLSHLGYDVVLL